MQKDVINLKCVVFSIKTRYGIMVIAVAAVGRMMLTDICGLADGLQRHSDWWSMAAGGRWWLLGDDRRDRARVLCFLIGGGDYATLEYYSSPSVSLTMSEEVQTADVAALLKFDMPSYESSMTANDIKSLAVRHNIPLDLHLVALTKGWTMDKLLNIVPSVNLFHVFYKVSKQGHWFSFEKRVGNGVGGQVFRETFLWVEWVENRFFFLDRRATPNAMAWRHHDSDVNDPTLGDGFSVSDVQTLTERVIDLRYQGECASIEKGTALTDQDQSAQHTTPPLLANQTIPDKTDHQKEVEVEDPKIIAIRKRKAQAAAKKRENKKRGADEGEGSHPKVKRRKASAARKDGSTTSEHIASPEPIQTVDPTGPATGNPSRVAVETVESREDRSLHVPPHDSTNHFVHNYTEARDDEDTNSLRLGSLVDHSGRNLTLVQTEVFQSSPGNHSVHPSPTVERMTTPTRSPCEVLMSRKTPLCGAESLWYIWLLQQLKRSQMLSIMPPHLRGLGLLRARGLGPDEHSRAARVDLEHNSILYNDMNVRYRRFKGKHDGYTEKLRVLEDQNSELSWVNKDQALRIKELDDVLAKKDLALVYAERINVKRAQEKEKLVAQLS
ncbi:hypothetical protein Tco_0980640 [Tanacetum coccineum]